jgi:preflagellin peptidase FlaK
MKEDGSVERKLMAFPKDETREAIVARLVSASNEGKIQEGVWATPGLPLLIFITAGLIIALFFGDLIWIILRFFLA